MHTDDYKGDYGDMKARHIDPALDRRSTLENANPYGNQQQLFLAKVVAVYSDKGTIDVALDATHHGGFYYDVPILSWSYATQTGTTYLPSNITLAAPFPSENGTYDQPIASGEQDVWAVIGHLRGRMQDPVCLGFMSPPQSQIHTKDPGYAVALHESGTSVVTTPDGQTQITLPDGSSIVIGTGTTVYDMTNQNPDWNPKTTTAPYNLTLNFKGNVSITVNGDATVDATSVYLGTTQGSGAAVARVGDTVNLSTGIIESGSSKVFSG